MNQVGEMPGDGAERVVIVDYAGRRGMSPDDLVEKQIVAAIGTRADDDY